MLSDPSGDPGAIVSTAKEIDEDAILAGDDESFSKPDESLLHNEDLLLSETSSIMTSTLTHKSASNTTATAAVVASNGSISNPTTTGTSKNVKSVEVANQPPKMKATNSVSSSKPIISPKNILTSEEKKQMRSFKFADPQLKSRAERFGLDSIKVNKIWQAH